VTAAITKVLASKGKAKFMAYDQIDKAPEERERRHYDRDGARGVTRATSGTMRTWIVRATQTT
jgi:translation elongation factor EF-Tu-like GTPase